MATAFLDHLERCTTIANRSAQLLEAVDQVDSVCAGDDVTDRQANVCGRSFTGNAGDHSLPFGVINRGETQLLNDVSLAHLADPCRCDVTA